MVDEFRFRSDILSEMLDYITGLLGPEGKGTHILAFGASKRIIPMKKARLTSHAGGCGC